MTAVEILKSGHTVSERLSPGTCANMSTITVPCPLCGNDHAEVIITGVRCHYPEIPGEYQFVRCRSCGMHYQNPRLDEETLGQAYQTIQAHQPPQESPAARPKSGLRRVLQKVWQNLNDPWPVLAFLQQGPVLDVGCNYGQFLQVLREKGWDCEGLEFNPHAVEQCRSLGFPVVQGDIRSAELSPNHYGSIVLMHTLEHLPDPVQVVKKLKTWLQPGGRILIVVPYIQSPMRRKFGACWHGWDPPFHLTHYDIPTMRKIAEQTGMLHERAILRTSPEDYTRSLNLARHSSQRRLLTRVALWPVMKMRQACGQGSYLITILQKPK
jgi:SAM-dependent methyltransferase